jgi:cytochrome P450
MMSTPEADLHLMAAPAPSQPTPGRELGEAIEVAPIDCSKQLRRIEDLPGPRALPLIGNLHQIKPQHIHQDVERWAWLYGSMFRFYLGRMPVLVVADHEAVAAVLRDRPEGFRRSRVFAKLIDEMGIRPGLFLAEGETWHRQRRLVMTAFAPGAVKAYFPSLVRVAMRVRRRWQEKATQQGSIDLLADLKRYSVDIVAGLVFGTDVNTTESADDPIQRHLDYILLTCARRSRAPFPYWRYIKLPRDHTLDRSVATVNAAVGDLIAEARRRMQLDHSLRENPRNLLEAMIAAADQDNSGVDDTVIVGNVWTMLLAGEDTTATSLAWTIYLLHDNPHTLRRARDEIARIVPDIAAMTIDQIDALDYLDACAQEAMRLKPAVPFMPPLEALRDTVVGDIEVPTGSVVWCVLRHDSVSQRHFPRPDMFEPERWLDDPHGHATSKKISMPFGAGPRICPGRYLALLKMKVALVMLLGSFDIDAIDTPNGCEVGEMMGLTMSPHRLTMKLRTNCKANAEDRNGSGKY